MSRDERVSHARAKSVPLHPVSRRAKGGATLRFWAFNTQNMYNFAGFRVKRPFRVPIGCAVTPRNQGWARSVCFTVALQLHCKPPKYQDSTNSRFGVRTSRSPHRPAADRFEFDRTRTVSCSTGISVPALQWGHGDSGRSVCRSLPSRLGLAFLCGGLWR